MKIFSQTALTAPLVSLAGTLFLVAPALARRDDAPIRPERNPAVAARREMRQALRFEHQEMHQTGRERRLSENIINTAENSLHNSFFANSVRTQSRLAADGRSMFVNSNEKFRAVTRGLELDLTSNNRSIVLGDNLFENQSTFTIKLGDQEKTLSAGSQVSPAEFIALQQVLNGGKQDLVIDASGRGVDGTFNIDSITDGGARIHAKSLVIPNNVEASGNLSRSSDFRLTGDLVNNGNVYLTDRANGSSIAARDVSNAAGAVIHGMGDLSIAADRDLINSGTISADGKLTVSAGNSISNSGTVSGATNLEILSPKIQNSGLMETQGSINISTPSVASIYFNSTGGTVSAVGNVSFRNSEVLEKVDTSLVGGSWNSSNLNLYSGDGNVSINVDDITGGVTVHSGTAVLNSSGPELHITELITTGDPLISSPGTIYLTSQTTNGAPLSVISGRDIFVQGVVDTSSTTGDGGDIFLVAGAQFTITGNILEITGASATGGSIIGTQIFTASSSVGNGGDIILAAFGTSSTTGKIDMDFGSVFRSTGAAGHGNGNVTIIAPTSIWAGQIFANGPGTASAGDILVSASQPLVSGALQIDTVSGALLGGSLSSSPATGSVNLASITGGIIDVSGRTVQLSNVDAVSSVTLSGEHQVTVNGAMTTPLLAVNLLGEGNASIGNDLNQIDLIYFAGDSTGTATLRNCIDLHIGSIGPNLSLDFLGTQSVIIDADLATTGDIAFTTTSLINSHSVTANSIRIFSPIDSMVVDGGSGGSFTATGTGEKVVIGSWLGDITLAGSLTFSGATEVTVSSAPSPITIATGASVVGNDSLTLNASSINWNGSISANPLVINYDAKGGTIANSEGDVVLTGPIIMNGGDLAILAAGDILMTGSLTINTSSATGDGGSVFIWAGVYLWPNTPGQIVDSFTSFTFGAGATGSVMLSNVDINTSSLNGTGGDVFVISDAGTISLGNIDASGTVGGGNLKLYGHHGIDVGNITNTGVVGGNIELNTTRLGLTYPPSFTIVNGAVTGDVTPHYASFEPYNVSVGAIDAGTGSVYVRAGDLTVRGPLTAHQIVLDSVNSLDLTALDGISLQQDTSGNGGTLEIRSRDILLSSDAANPFTVTADGHGDGNGGSVTISEYSDRTHTYVGNVGNNAIAGSQFLEISAQSGDGVGGHGGLIRLSTGGDLTVDTRSLKAGPIGSGPSDGATYQLYAGSSEPGGRLLVIGDLIADGINGGAGGKIELRSVSEVDFVLHTGGKIPKSGVTGVLSALGVGGNITVLAARDISVSTQEALQATSQIRLATGYGTWTPAKKSSISVRKNVVLTADEIILNVGSEKTSTKQLSVDTKRLEVSGKIKSIKSVSTAPLQFNGSLYYTDFNLSSQSDVNIEYLNSYHGDVSITSITGGITLLDNTSPGAINAAGDIVLHALNGATGSIRLEENTKIYTSPKGGDITLAVGKIIKGRHTVAPANVSASGNNGGKVFFETGPDVVAALGSPTLISAKKHSVLISSSAGQKITFEGGNRIAASDEVVPMMLSTMPRLTLQSAALTTDIPLTSSTAETGNATVSTNLNLTLLLPATPSSNQLIPSLDGIGSTKQSSALPIDLLTNQIAGPTSQPIPVNASQNGTTYGITDAFIWSDQELGIGKHRMLKLNGSGGAESSKTSLNGGSNNEVDKVEVANFRKGTIVVCPSKDTKLETPLGAVEISANAIVFVSLDENRLAVYDLHDEHNASVKVSTGKKSASLHPGRFLLVTNNVQHSFEALNPMENVGYRSLNGQNHGSERQVFCAEFSPLSLLNSVIPLRALCASQHTDAKRLSAKVLKTAAVLMHLGNNEEFKNYSAPTRMANSKL